MMKKKIKMRILAFTVAAMVAVTPVTTFAESTKEVIAEDGNRTTEIDDVSVNGDYEDAVYISADGHSADISTGSLDSESGTGLYSLATNKANTDVDVTGDIKAGGNGVSANTYWGSEQHININGNITAGENGVIVNTSDYSEYVMEGDESEKNGDSKTYISINGNIESDTVGVDANAYAGGENFIEVTGDIEVAGGSEAEESGSTINSWAIGKYSSNNIAVEGNVFGNEIGVYLYTDGVDAVNNIVIDGTVSANDAAFLIDNGDTVGKNSITVWKVETSGNTVAGWRLNDKTDRLEMVDNADAQKQVQYIIKTKPTENATITATDVSGNPLATVAGVGGKLLEFAHEGDKVLLKIDVKDGYQLDAVYGDEDQKLELIKDSSGNYYTVIPRNGGVIFSVKLSEIVKENKKTKETKVDIDIKEDKKFEENTPAAEVAAKKEDADKEYTSPAIAFKPDELVLTKTTGLPYGTRAVKAEQGPAEKAMLKAARPAGYKEGFTFNLITHGKAETTLKTGTITMVIPKKFQKEGRTFAIIGLDKNGETYNYVDKDTDPATITFDVHMEGYVFSFIYKD